MKISRQKPPEKSLDYEFLRGGGLKHIEELSSRIWTDYNVHDPGITTLELDLSRLPAGMFMITWTETGIVKGHARLIQIR